MSEIAINESGERKTASEFHDDYILHNIQHDMFFCPFCGIKLIAKAIYISSPQAKSPYFSHYPGQPHINGCDGYPMVNGKTTKKPSSNLITIGKDTFTFPEKLVERRTDTKTVLKPKQLAQTERDVKLRRQQIGRELGKAKYTSSLIKAFASSREAIVSKICTFSKEQNFSEQQRRDLFKTTFSKIPIDLEGYRTTYYKAFQKTQYFSRYKRIWYGKGNVQRKGNILYVKSNKLMYYKDNDLESNLTFYMAINLSSGAESISKNHQDMIDCLKEANQKKYSVKWFGYGEVTKFLDKKAVRLDIENLNHMYVRF